MGWNNESAPVVGRSSGQSSERALDKVLATVEALSSLASVAFELRGGKVRPLEMLAIATRTVSSGLKIFNTWKPTEAPIDAHQTRLNFIAKQFGERNRSTPYSVDWLLYDVDDSEWHDTECDGVKKYDLYGFRIYKSGFLNWHMDRDQVDPLIDACTDSFWKGSQAMDATTSLSPLTIPTGFIEHAWMKPFTERVGRFQKLKPRTWLLNGEYGTGKALRNSTKVCTPSGWTAIGSLKVGDDVIGRDGHPAKVLGVHPQGEQEIVRLTFSDKHTVDCTWDHLWHVADNNQRNRNQHSVLTTRQIIDRGLRAAQGQIRNYIPVSGIWQLDAQPVPLDPYTLGVLIGDGSLTQGRASFTNESIYVQDRVRSLLPSGHTLSIANDNDVSIVSTGRVGENIVLNALRRLELMGTHSAEKFIPSCYLRNSVDVRLNLLQGLMDTDGYVTDNGTCVQYATVSTRLRDGVRELVESLGGKVTIVCKAEPTFMYKGERKIGQPCYILTLNVPYDLPIVTRPEKAARYALRASRCKERGNKMNYGLIRSIVGYEVVGRDLATCIEVDTPDHLFVIEGGIVTHNTLSSIVIGLRFGRVLSLDASGLNGDGVAIQGKGQRTILQMSTVLNMLKPDVLVINDIDRVKDTTEILHVLDLAKKHVKVAFLSSNYGAKLDAAAQRVGRIDEIIQVPGLTPIEVRTVLGTTYDWLEQAGKPVKELVHAMTDWPHVYVQEFIDAVTVEGVHKWQDEFARIKKRRDETRAVYLQRTGDSGRASSSSLATNAGSNDEESEEDDLIEGGDDLVDTSATQSRLYDTEDEIRGDDNEEVKRIDRSNMGGRSESTDEWMQTRHSPREGISRRERDDEF